MIGYSLLPPIRSLLEAASGVSLCLPSSKELCGRADDGSSGADARLAEDPPMAYTALVLAFATRLRWILSLDWILENLFLLFFCEIPIQ